MAATDRVRSALAERYSIDRELGAGGMATVYLARDLKHDREVALKVLRDDLSAVIGTERFLAEIRIAARLDHPHILTLIDSGSADGILYYVLPYVRGESLRAKLDREKQLGVHDALSITTQVASALDYAHAQGVVHRDIKPENILLHEGEAVLADFGIALAVQQAGGNRLTETGLSLGTPKYMSPEQAMGDRSLDRRSDVYSLGAVFYEMIAGEPPVTGPSAQAIIAKLLTEKPVKLRVVREAIPLAMERATEKALFKVPADRFGSAGEFARALSAAAPERETLLSGSRIRWAAMAMAAVAVIGTGLWLAGGSAWVPGRDRSPGVASASATGDGRLDEKYVVAVLPFENLSADTAKGYVAAGMTEEITGHLSRLSALRVLSQAALGPYRGAPDRLQKMVKDLGVGSVVEGSVRAEGDRARIAVQLINARSGQAIWSQDYDRQLTDIFAVQKEVAQSITGALEATLTPDEARRAGRPLTVDLEAYQLYVRAGRLPMGNLLQHAAAARLLRRAIALDTTFSRAYVALARRYLFLATRNPAYQDSGLMAVRKAITIDPDNASAYLTLGSLQGESGQLRPAKASLLKALELNPSLHTAAYDLSYVLNMLGDYDEALYWALHSVPLAPTNPNAYYHVGSPLLRLGDDAAAERFLVRAEQRFEGLPRLHMLLSILDALRGRNGAAMDRARQLVISNHENDEAQLNLAEIAVITGAQDADTLLQPIVRAGPESRGEMLPESMRSLYAWALAARGRRAEADSLWNDALAAARRDLSNGNEKPDRRMEIAAISAMRRDTAGALEWLERGYKAGYKDYGVLARDPLFEPVRAHPRFRQVASQMKADVAAMHRRAAARNDTLFATAPRARRP